MRCKMKKDSSCVGMSLVLISTTVKELRRDCNRKTSLYVKKSTRHPCLKRLLEPREHCKLCCRAFPKLRQVILRSSSLAKRERAKSLLRGPSTDDQTALRAHSLA